MKAIVTTVLAFFALGIFAAEIPKAPVPPSPYLPIIYKFADAMLERGRDTNGLFHSALDRAALAPLTNRPPAPAGVREEDRALTGANSKHQQNFLRLLYILSELSAKPKYRDASDAELRRFVEPAGNQRYSGRPWMLWDRSFQLAPTAAGDAERLRTDLKSSPREAGFFIRKCAVAYERTTNELVLKPVDSLLGALENSIDPSTGLMDPGSSNVWLASILSLAIDCDAASRLVPTPLAERFQKFTGLQDHIFCSSPHGFKHNKGFVLAADFASGKFRERWSQLWNLPRDIPTTAQIGMMCVSRYENTGNVEFRDLIHEAAGAYLHSLPPDNADVWPMTLGHAISLQVAAWRSTARQDYLDSARAFADFAVKHFFDQGPLPRASLKSNHYEAITGADTLALGLVELHLHVLAITAVRYPPNTIDR